ncbi:MAG: TonB-dependent receptor [Flavobacteriaceae bacterium]|nr:TonB-dependent receptor [Flavobacteriaceae bacterium]
MRVYAHFLLRLLFLFSLSYCLAREKFSYSGTVYDQSSGEVLIGATLEVDGSALGVITNNYGFFSITLPKGTYKFNISYLGYQTLTKEIVLTKSIKSNGYLKPNSYQIDEIILESNNQIHQLKNPLTGISALSSSEIKNLPLLMGEPDINRAIHTLSGISTVGEGASGFNVRGGGIDQNLILLDEAPIYNTSHLWGFMSVFNTDAIKNIKLYKGGIPARFGGRGSSVLDVRQREGNTNSFRGKGGIGFISSRLTLEGPIVKGKLSFLVSARRSYFDVLFPNLSDIDDSKVYFYDASTKLTWIINENNRLYVSGYFGADVLKFGFEESTQSDGSIEPEEAVDFQWRNTTTTLRWNRIFSDRLFMNLSAIYSQYNYKLNAENDTGGGPANTFGTFEWKSKIDNWILKTDLTWYYNTHNTYRMGANATRYRFTPARVESIESGINKVAFQQENALALAPYIEWDYKRGALSILAGLRYSWFASLGPYTTNNYDPLLPKTANNIVGTTSFDQGTVIKDFSAWEPRLALAYQLNDRSTLKLGLNRNYQYIQLISNTTAALPFDIWKPASNHIKPLSVHLASIGYVTISKNKTYSYGIEGYYKTFENLVEYINGADLFLNELIETQLISADGKAYGIELNLKKSRGKLKGNVNYTYSVSERKTTSIFSEQNIQNGNYYPSNYDKPHIFNTTIHYKLNKKWSISGYFTYQTGRPYTKAVGRFNINEKDFIVYSERNAFRLPDNHRLDLSFHLSPNRKPNKKWKGNWSFGVYNIYGNKNVFSRYTNFLNDELKTYDFSVIGAPIPFVNYNLSF